MLEAKLSKFKAQITGILVSLFYLNTVTSFNIYYKAARKFPKNRKSWISRKKGMSHLSGSSVAYKKRVDIGFPVAKGRL